VRRSFLILGVLAVLAGCAVERPAPVGGPAATDAGPPQRGGSAVLLQVTEPRTLDPAVLTNAFAGNGVVGNALFGTLLTTEQDTGELRYGLAEDLATTDGGLTWTLTLREGLEFSDGSALDAAAVKVNWDRIKDPTLGSQSLPTARYVASTTATDARTLTFTLTTPVANFGQSIAGSSLNWIASPAALAAGQQAFDAAPIGAGPFVLTEWARQDRMDFARNPTYHDPELPYLDELTMRTNTDENQRLATLTSGGGDVMISINPQLADKAEAEGREVTRQELNGGNGLLFNTAVAPFDDPRAREAITRAIDLEALNAAVYSGKGTVPETLFRDGSPFFSDLPSPPTTTPPPRPCSTSWGA
jgi:peptide/nickel transport system substrate-binding protein